MSCGWETVDYSGVLLVCSHTRWEEHIIDGHPEMEGQQAAVITALRDPYFVYLPAGSWVNRRVYYRPLALRAPDTNRHLVVVADYPSRRRRFGRVVTAYPKDKFGKGDTLLWTNPRIAG